MNEDDASLLSFLEEHRMVYVKNKIWYYPKNNIWVKTHLPLQYIIQNMEHMPDKMGDYNPAIRAINKCKPYLHNPDFERILDSNRNLIPFKNGVFDVQTKTFRNIEVDDYITTVIQYDWCHEDDEAIQKEIRDIVNMNVGGREDIWDLLKKLVTNPAEKVIVLYGRLNSGRDVLLRLVSCAFDRFTGPVSLDDLQKMTNGVKKWIEGSKFRIQCYYDMSEKRFKFKQKYRDNILNRKIGVVVKVDALPIIEEGFGEEHIEVVKFPNHYVGDREIRGLWTTFGETRYIQQFMRMLLC